MTRDSLRKCIGDYIHSCMPLTSLLFDCHESSALLPSLPCKLALVDKCDSDFGYECFVFEIIHHMRKKPKKEEGRERGAQGAGEPHDRPR